MSGNWVLSIDYGTSNTVAMLRWPDGRVKSLLFDGSPLLPSSVYLDADGHLLVGRDAQRSLRLDPTRYEPNPKRRIDDSDLVLARQAIPLTHVMAAALRRVAEEAARTAGMLPSTVLMTHPAAWGPTRQNTLVEAANLAGLPRPVLIPEPVAAASYFTMVLKQHLLDGQHVVVYDLGAGTLDISAVRRTSSGFEVTAIDGRPDFGGLDLDAMVFNHVGSHTTSTAPDAWRRLTSPESPSGRRHLRMLWEDARSAKETLSREPHATVSIPMINKEVIITREEFETCAQPVLHHTALLTRTLLERAGITRGRLSGLFLVGGATRVPLVATALHRGTGATPTVLEQPEIVVAEGALHASHVTSGLASGSRPTAIPLSFGHANRSPASRYSEEESTPAGGMSSHSLPSPKAWRAAIASASAALLIGVMSISGAWALGYLPPEGIFTKPLGPPCSYVTVEAVDGIVDDPYADAGEARDGHPLCVIDSGLEREDNVMRVTLRRFTRTFTEGAPTRAAKYFATIDSPFASNLVSQGHTAKAGDEARYWAGRQVFALAIRLSNLIVIIEVSGDPPTLSAALDAAAEIKEAVH